MKTVITRGRWRFQVVCGPSAKTFTEEFTVPGYVSQRGAWQQCRERFGSRAALHVIETPQRIVRPRKPKAAKNSRKSKLVETVH